MKRWILFAFIGVVTLTFSLLAWHQYLANFLPTHPPQSGLTRTPESAFKYNLCTEAYAFAHATPNNPYKTDFTFYDPFRKDTDTIIPHLLDYDSPTQTVSFSVDIIISHVATFHTPISQIHERDGLSVLLPDLQNHLQVSIIPQVIIASFGTGHIAILDYTCQNQWVWRPNH